MELDKAKIKKIMATYYQQEHTTGRIGSDQLIESHRLYHSRIDRSSQLCSNQENVVSLHSTIKIFLSTIAVSKML